MPAPEHTGRDPAPKAGREGEASASLTGVVVGTPRLLLRLENLAIMFAAIGAYAWLNASWWLFVALFLLPDVSITGYLRGPRLGAAIYNAGHWYGVPAILIATGLTAHGASVSIGLIWVAHIAFDRTIGFGLKYPDGFGASHLGRAAAQ